MKAAMKGTFIENIIKNIILVVLLILIYPEVQNSLNTANFIDKSAAGSILTAIGLVSVIACFGNFAFTYEKVENKKFRARLFAHVTTGFLMLVIGLTLEMTSVIVKNMISVFPIFDISLLLLYIASVLYDFWDLERAVFA